MLITIRSSSLQLATYRVFKTVRANQDFTRLEWIHEVVDEHDRTTIPAAIDTKDVVAFSKHNGAVACRFSVTAAHSHVYLEAIITVLGKLLFKSTLLQLQVTCRKSNLLQLLCYFFTTVTLETQWCSCMPPADNSGGFSYVSLSAIILLLLLFYTPGSKGTRS